MPDLGLKEALEQALKGAKGAKVVRPAEKQLAEQEAAKTFQKGLEAEQAAKDAYTPPSEPRSRVTPAPPEKTVPPSEPGTRVKQPTSPLDEMTDNPQPPQGVAEPSAVPAQPPAPEQVFTKPAFTYEEKIAADARDLVNANLGDFKLDVTHMPNFDVINTGDDIKGAIAQLAEKNKAAIEVERGPAFTRVQANALADDIGITPDTVMSILGRETGSGVPDNATIIGTRLFINASAAKIRELAVKVDDGLANDFDKVALTRQIQLHNAVNAKFMGARADWGRAGHAFGMPVGGDTFQLSRINDILSSSGTDMPTIAKAIRMADSTNGINQIVKTSLLRRAGRATERLVIRNMLNGILSGPVTHAVNTAGNAIFLGMNLTEMAVAARVGRFFNPDEAIQVGEAMATFRGLTQGTSDAWRLAAKALRSGETLDNQVKFGLRGQQSTRVILPEIDKLGLGGLADAIDAATGVSFRFLGAEDEFFKGMEYRGALTRFAYLDTTQKLKSGAIQPGEVEQSMRAFVENPTPDVEAAAEDWAREMTFQAPLGSLGQGVQRVVNEHPFLRLIAPFIQTPTNIFKQAAYRSPVALLAPKFWNDVAAGGARRDLALTRFAMGTATAAAMAELVASGRATGAGPQDPTARMLWQADGKRPYSVLVLDPMSGNYVWKSYARMEPAASIMGSVADTVELTAALNRDVDTLDPEKDAQAYQAAGAVVAAIVENTGNKTFTQGISNFFEFTSSPGQQFKSYAGQMAVAQIPYSALLRSVRNMKDPYLREAWTIHDKLRDALPVFSETLPINPGLFGEPREKNSSTLLGTMSPWPESPQKYDVVITELQRVMTETNKVPLTMPARTIGGLTLKPEEYAKLVHIARTEPAENGMTLHDKLFEIIHSPQYKDLPVLGQMEMLRQYQTKYDDRARRLLPQEDLSFARRQEAFKERKARLTTPMGGQ